MARLLVDKHKLCGRVLLPLIVFLLVAVASFGAAPVGAAPDEYEKGPPPVHIPVVLDGVHYEPEEFNLIHKKLHSEGVYMHFVVLKDGSFYAFTTIEGFNEFAANHGLPPYYKPSGEERPGKIVKDGDGNVYVFGPNSKDMDIPLVR